MTGAASAAGGPTFLGHPRGLAFLALTEAWERFSFYGMVSLLLLYLIQSLLIPGTAEQVYGLAWFREMLESISGPLSNQGFASQIFGLYTGLVYFTPVFGGLLADRILGQKRTVILGASLMSAGHMLMVLDAGFLAALGLLVVGTGCLKGNISTQVGHLYPDADDSRRTRAFAIFSAAINLGALSGPIACGIVAQIYGWHVGFGLSGVLMLLGLATYLSGWKYLPPDIMRKKIQRTGVMSAQDRRKIVALILLSVVALLATTAYNQQTNGGLLFIEESVDRNLFGWTIPSTTFVALDGFFCILSVPFLVALWKWQARRGREAGDIRRIAVGYILTAAANLLMIIPAASAAQGASVSMLWVVGLFALNALAFIHYWPTLLALFSRVSPASVNSTMMGVLFLSNFVGNILVGMLGTLWEKISHPSFFLLHAGLGIAACLLMLIFRRPFERILNGADEDQSTAIGSVELRRR